MTRGPTTNLSASVRARLLSLAQSRREDYQRILGRYAIERFLYRLGRSKYRDKFALKGATLSRFGPGRRTGLQRTWTYSAEVCRLPSRRLKQSSGKSVLYEKMTASFFTPNRWKAPGSKKTTNTMEYASNFRPN